MHQQQPRFLATGDRIVRTVRKPEALPLGSLVLDNDGIFQRRHEDGWRPATSLTAAPVGTLDLVYPVRLLSETKPYHQDRKARRQVEVQARKAHAPTIAARKLKALAGKRAAYLDHKLNHGTHSAATV